MPKPPVKKTYKVEKARIKAQLDAQDEHDAKGFNWFPFAVGKGKKRVIASIVTHIGKAVDRVEPLEVAAVLGATFIVHNIIVKTPETLNYIQEKALGGELGYFEKLMLYGPINWPLFTVARQLYGEAEKGVEQAIEEQGEIMVWVISFVVAYVCVKHFGLIVESLTNMGKGVLSLTHFLIGKAL